MSPRSQYPEGKTSTVGLSVTFWVVGALPAPGGRFTAEEGPCQHPGGGGGNNSSLITPLRSKHLIRILLVELEVFLLLSGLRKRNGNGGLV